VRRYWRQAVRKYHPDLFPTGSPEQQSAGARLREINSAYERLKGYLEPGSGTA
jgi:curved DNA-binding protein CbpA